MKMTLDSIVPGLTIAGMDYRDIEFQHKTEKEIIWKELQEKEKLFSLCNREETPTLWYRLQNELGELYHRIMTYYRF